MDWVWYAKERFFAVCILDTRSGMSIEGAGIADVVYMSLPSGLDSVIIHRHGDQCQKFVCFNVSRL